MVEEFLHTVTPWFVDFWEVSLMPDSSDIVAEADGPDQERRQRRKTRKLGLVARFEVGVEV